MRISLLLFLVAVINATVPTTARAQGPNTWTTGTPLPNAIQGPATGVIGGLVYVVGGASQDGAPVSLNQIYNPDTNSWTAGPAMPTARFVPAGAVVNNILYVIGGNSNGNQLNVVEAFDPVSNTWTTESPMPTPRDSISAVVSNGLIYVIGGYNNSSDRLTTVESYDPASDTWTEESPLLIGKSEAATGLLGSTIVAAGGLTSSGSVTGDNEGYNASSNSWTTLASDPTARQAGCFATISGQLYSLMGSSNSGPVSLAESFNLAENQWTTLTPAPLAQVGAGSATVDSLLYCFGGSNNGAAGQGTVYSNVQIYHPVFQSAAVVSSAYSLAIGVAPGMLATAYGTDLASSTPGATTLPLPTTDAGTSVSILDSNGDIWMAPLLYVSPGQVNFEVPAGVALGTAEFSIASGDGTVSGDTVQVGVVAPGVFELNASALAAADVLTVSGPDEIYGNVFSVNGSGAIVASPISVGDPGEQTYLILFGTGFEAAGTSGVTVTIGGVNASVAYAGTQGSLAGLDQANVLIPASLAGAGNVTIQLTANGIAANPVNVTIQ